MKLGRKLILGLIVLLDSLCIFVCWVFDTGTAEHHCRKYCDTDKQYAPSERIAYGYEA